MGIIQEPGESVHAFYGRICVNATDLGYDDCSQEMRDSLTVEAYMHGLLPVIKEKLLVAAPDWRACEIESLLAKSEGIQAALLARKPQAAKIMVVQEDTQIRGGDIRRNVICWYCAIQGHLQRQCRKARQDKAEGRWEPAIPNPNVSRPRGDTSQFPPPPAMINPQ